MGIFTRLFGEKKPEVKVEITPVEYKGFYIYQEALEEGRQFRVAGRITKSVNEQLQTHTFIRSDVLPTEQEANELMLKKSQLFIDQMGDNIFS
ncbi:HlyU family transcriptional regulator [Vibrio palustris]|uniref:Transcriptional activator HlyU n=1 Tax=Vibrio palustris TaxID=1918946 RepID=A0A1R4B4M5_9VIBR|nr:HlyU family transcriptional regulator [Vibrio palustris]SJL83853.1 Transcriptional activator HlyU [Vibrio palustris]